MEYKKYLKLFKDMGLTEREAKVYMTLLKKRMYTASELQEAANIPRTKIYEVVQKMVNHGICVERRLGRNKVFEAIEPEVAFGQLYEDYENELNRKKQVMNKLVEVFTPMYNEGKIKENPLDYIEVLKEKNEIHKKYLTLLNKTNFELLTFNKPPYSCDTSEKMREQDKAEIELMNRGGVSKGLYEYEEASQDSEFTKSMKMLIDIGHQAKLIKSLPVKMIVFDGKAVMFALDEPGTGNDDLTMIVIEHKSVANACKILFGHLWLQAEEVQENEEKIVSYK